MNKVWTYIINIPLSDTELDQLLIAGKKFVSSWTAHENQLTGSFEIYQKRIIVVKVNEEVNAASGCSIDKLTRFIKVSEPMFGVELMNRLLVAYKKNDAVEIVHSSKVKELLDQNILSENTIIYNTSIATENDLQNWEQPLKNTWLSKYLTKA